MEVRHGYKQTEVGIIPEDWEVKLLPDVCRFQGGKAHEQHISEYGKYVCVNSKFISTNGRDRKYTTINFCPAKRNDILMVMSDLPNGRALAKAYLADQDNLYAVNQRVCALTPYHDSAGYLFYVLNRNPYFLKFDDGVNQTHLLNPVFERCPVALPPTKAEQQAIADVLGDGDAFIKTLEQLISKRHRIKEGAMHELLTGEKRLPGFSKTWRNKELREIADIDSDNLSADTRPNYTFNYIALEDVDQGRLRGYSEIAFGNAPSRARRRVQFGDVLVATVRPNLKSHLLIDIPVRDWVCSTGFSVVRCDLEKAVPHFVFFNLFGSEIGRQIDQLIAGSNYPAISGTDVKALQLRLPEPVEQEAIATVLSDMDAEIVALEANLIKARQLKQGMMQELLTGKTRLI